MRQIFSKHDGHVGEKPMRIFGSKLKISLQILAEVLPNHLFDIL